jgi:RNA polymerase sigma-70 factor, ECF subfamily
MGSLLFERFTAAARDSQARLGQDVWAELARRLAATEQATPGTARDPYEFCTQVLRLLGGAPDALAELARLHLEDMYLAWALAQNDRAAFARFEAEFLVRLAGQVAPGQPELRGELEQDVRTRLFVPDGERPPRITQYSGRGPFAAWLRVVGKRAALDLHRARAGAGVVRELESPQVATDPELDYLKLRYADDFKIVLEHALSRLDARQVTLLKLSFIEQLSAAAIGVMYGVSGRTVQRWLLELREMVLETTRDGLKARLSMSPAELDSLLGIMLSQLHVSLSRVLDPQKR